MDLVRHKLRTAPDYWDLAKAILRQIPLFVILSLGICYKDFTPKPG